METVSLRDVENEPRALESMLALAGNTWQVSM
jgi:hypothetical protein